MTEFIKIKDYIKEFEDLFEKLEMNYNLPLPFIYTYCDVIDDEDYYGYNFSKDQKIYMLFYNGSSNFFAGIYKPKNSEQFEIDELPIYIFDLSNTNCPIKKIGNFKTYMKQIFDSIKDKVLTKALSRLDDFSDKLIKCEYLLKNNEM
jgi:hypothetical protein